MTNEWRPLHVFLSHPVGEFMGVAPQMLNDIARAQLNLRCNPEHAPDFGSLATCFRLVESPAEADVHLLPFTWNWYLETSRLDLVKEAIDQARGQDKPIVLFSSGDYTATVPFSGLTIFQACAYRSRRFENGNRVFAMPAFISDFVELYCGGQLPLRQKGPRPVVGFCGLAGGKWYRLAYRLAKLRIHRLSFRLGLNPWEPPPFEPTIFRHKVLSLLRESPEIECKFILRDRYRAGYRAPKKDPFHPTRLEYVQNMLESDYIVCMRGGGNFSVRFYETLSMGRIPVVIDTDHLLPYDGIINYRQYTVWVQLEELLSAARKIKEFHSYLSSEQFLELQKRCRALWCEYLSREGFWRHFHRFFETES